MKHILQAVVEASIEKAHQRIRDSAPVEERIARGGRPALPRGPLGRGPDPYENWIDDTQAEGKAHPVNSTIDVLWLSEKWLDEEDEGEEDDDVAWDENVELYEEDEDDVIQYRCENGPLEMFLMAPVDDPYEQSFRDAVNAQRKAIHVESTESTKIIKGWANADRVIYPAKCRLSDLHSYAKSGPVYCAGYSASSTIDPQPASSGQTASIQTSSYPSYRGKGGGRGYL